MKFELGKYYQHTTGSKLYICGLGETIIYGSCLVGEDEHGDLIAVGKSEENAVNYSEITKEQFRHNKNDMLDCFINLINDGKIALMPYQEKILKDVLVKSGLDKDYDERYYLLMRKGRK